MELPLTIVANRQHTPPSSPKREPLFFALSRLPLSPVGFAFAVTDPPGFLIHMAATVIIGLKPLTSGQEFDIVAREIVFFPRWVFRGGAQPVVGLSPPPARERR